MFQFLSSIEEKMQQARCGLVEGVHDVHDLETQMWWVWRCFRVLWMIRISAASAYYESLPETIKIRKFTTDEIVRLSDNRLFDVEI